MSIPKIIHYCWFGPKEIPEMEQKCIASWRRVLPDYQIILWNEQNFDINSVSYVKEAYEQKKYAFVSDYVRMYALYNFGGVYFDTDVEVLKSLDGFLNDVAFIGFENRTMIGTGIIGAEKHAPIFKKMLNYYNTHSFIDGNGNMDTTTNVQIISQMLKEQGFEPHNMEQILPEIHIYERYVFCPKKMDDGTFAVTEQSVTIHKFAGSWLTEREKRRGTNLIWRNIMRPILKVTRTITIKVFGEQKAKKLEASLRNALR